MTSIKLCREILTALNGQMLEFDLRNGPLRRKYDSLKYALRRVEDIWYELSLVTDATAEAPLNRMFVCMCGCVNV